MYLSSHNCACVFVSVCKMEELLVQAFDEHRGQSDMKSIFGKDMSSGAEPDTLLERAERVPVRSAGGQH